MNTVKKLIGEIKIMITVKPITEELRRCHGCLTRDENKKIYELLFEQKYSGIQVILCEDCLKQLCGKVLDILTEDMPVVDIDSFKGYHPINKE